MKPLSKNLENFIYENGFGILMGRGLAHRQDGKIYWKLNLQHRVTMVHKTIWINNKICHIIDRTTQSFKHEINKK